ncbi:lipopolysaccharide biosynthesis protein [Parenemella sanctibonifatiensis]|uniref:lipopolysaccharide biosynthesis protein n=1 Tax=Parenemella sanctibonifatiensis TaxID=2016505 RepID=UPI0011859B91|nr:hypothetical protein [Parenemella sanctibonifatiensis]
MTQWYLIWLLARTAGPDGVGVYSAALAVATPLFTALRLGLRSTFLSAMTRWPESVYWRLRIGGLAASVLILLALILILPGIPVGLGVAIAALKVSDGIVDLCQARVQYADRMSFLGWSTIANSVGTAIAASIAVTVTGEVVAVVIASAAVSAASAAWTAYVGRTVTYVADTADGAVRGILSAGIPITVSQFLANLLIQLPVIALTMVDPATVGRYAAAAYLVAAASMAGATLQILLLTPFRRIRETSGAEAVRAYASRVLRSVMLIAALCGVVVVLLGAPVLTFVYGAEFALDHLSLAFLAIAAIATVGSPVQSVVLTVLNRYKTVTMIMTASCVGSVLAGLAAFGLAAPPIVCASAMAATGASVRYVLLNVFMQRATRDIAPDEWPEPGAREQQEG